MFKNSIYFLTLLYTFNLYSSSLNYLSSFIVHTTSDLNVKCSDFLGNVAVGGNAYLDHFLINSEINDAQNCPLSALGHIAFRNGSVAIGKPTILPNGTVTRGQSAGCIQAGHLYTEKVSYFNPIKIKSTNFDELNRQRETLGELLNDQEIRSKFNIIELSASLLKRNKSGYRELYIKNDQRPILLFSEDSSIDLDYLGLFFSDEEKINPSKIMWYFPNAKRVYIFKTGISSLKSEAKRLGIPGTFFAPHANFIFHESLITGAVYVESIFGGMFKQMDSFTCDLSSGQINFNSFDISILNTKNPIPSDDNQDEQIPRRCRRKKC